MSYRGGPGARRAALRSGGGGLPRHPAQSHPRRDDRHRRRVLVHGRRALYRRAHPARAGGRAGARAGGSARQRRASGQRRRSSRSSQTPASRCASAPRRGILHWKMMLFAGQGQVEFSGANYSPDALVPTPIPTRNYVDEAIYFTDDPAIVHSFMQRFDDLWTDTGVVRQLRQRQRRARRAATPATRSIAGAEFPAVGQLPRRAPSPPTTPRRTAIDVIMYPHHRSRAHRRDHRRGAARRAGAADHRAGGIPRLRAAVGLVERRSALHGRRRRSGSAAHAGLNHQKSVILRSARGLTIFGSSNWTSAVEPVAGRAQRVHRPSHGSSAGSATSSSASGTTPVRRVETQPFVPLPPGEPVYAAPAEGATSVSADAGR